MGHASVKRARVRLRATGERATAIRERVLAALLEAKRPVSHHELESQLAPIDKVTLYRVLDWLVAQRIAHRVAGDDRVRRFAVAEPRHAEHAHFECLRCSAVSCLSDLPSRSLAVTIPHGYRLDTVELTAKGLCARCA
jgi:Fur family ferric uptake transcriptional regulator